MKVKAIRLGYYGNARRRVGDVFHVESEKEFSKNWMEKVSDKPKPKVKGAKVEPEKEDEVSGADVI